MKTIALSAKQRQEIQDRRREAGDRRIYQRLSALLWIDEGRSREEVAALLGVSSRQVGDWLRIFRNQGLDRGAVRRYLLRLRRRFAFHASFFPVSGCRSCLIRSFSSVWRL